MLQRLSRQLFFGLARPELIAPSAEHRASPFQPKLRGISVFLRALIDIYHSLGLSLFEYSFNLLTKLSKSSCFSLRRSNDRLCSSGLYLCGVLRVVQIIKRSLAYQEKLLL